MIILLLGVGGLTTFIVDAMGDLRDKEIEYSVSDLSPLVSSHLVQSFKDTSCKMISATYDISKLPLEQGLPLGQFDIILGLNVIHAAPDLKYTLSNLLSLLSPGGHLLVVDPDGTNSNQPGRIWMDFIFGVFPGWFGFTDERAHCSCSPAEWKQALNDVGFGDVRVCTEDTAMNLLIDAARK